MKIRVILTLICLCGLKAFGQFYNKTHPGVEFGDYIYFDALADGQNVLYGNTLHGIYVPDDAVFRIFDKNVSDYKLSSPVALGIKLDPKLAYYSMTPVQSFSKSFPAFRIHNKSAATVIAMGINKDNIGDWRYHVVLNDSTEIVQWSKIPKLEQQYGAKQPYGFIGEFNYPGKQAFIEVVNTKNYHMRSGVVFDWRSELKPFVFTVIGSAREGVHDINPDFDLKTDTITKKVLAINCVKGTTATLSLYLKQHPGIAFGSGITRMENGNLLYRSQGHEEDASGAISFDVDTLPVGKYQLNIFPVTQGHLGVPGQNSYIELNITAPPKSTSILEKKTSYKQLLPYLIGAALCIALLFWLYRRRANLRLAKAAQGRQNVNLKLRSIRAQLNPHFMFNALTSIQNLVNKQDMEGANHYLSRFASLTRKVLNTGEKELISLEEELKILDDYLQMEQLRFGFQYHIEADPGINLANIEVPAMLLQPFVENAVKHGAADLRERGEIIMAIKTEQNNLNLIVIDNGLGFKHQVNQQSNTSFGLKLSEERIELLNEVYADKPFSLHTQTGDSGTTVTITLANWIS